MLRRESFLHYFYPGFKQLFNISETDFLKYYDASTYGGMPELPIGTIFESEAKALYALIRILKPNRILEIGNYKGNSSNHILQAIEDNQCGEIVLLDIEEQLDYDKLHNNIFERVVADSLDYLQQQLNFDLIIQDGNHNYQHVKTELELILKNNSNTNYYIYSHDYYMSIRKYIEVERVWSEMKHNFNIVVPFKDDNTVLINNNPMYCGFCIANKIK